MAGLARTARDAEYEQRFLREVVKEAARRFALVNATGYATTVTRRLAIGAQRYGDDDFLRKDLICELLEETPDVGAYAVLEVQKELASDLEPDGNRIAHLFEAAVYAAAADWHARQARK